jgi:hypothetical protein
MSCVKLPGPVDQARRSTPSSDRHSICQEREWSSNLYVRVSARLHDLRDEDMDIFQHHPTFMSELVHVFLCLCNPTQKQCKTGRKNHLSPLSGACCSTELTARNGLSLLPSPARRLNSPFLQSRNSLLQKNQIVPYLNSRKPGGSSVERRRAYPRPQASQGAGVFPSTVTPSQQYGKYRLKGLKKQRILAYRPHQTAMSFFPSPRRCVLYTIGARLRERGVRRPDTSYTASTRRHSRINTRRPRSYAR